MCFWSLLINLYQFVFDEYTVLGLKLLFLYDVCVGGLINWKYTQLSPQLHFGLVAGLSLAFRFSKS